MNPILARELRVRFRDKRSFWLLFGLIALLCLAAGWIYADAVTTLERSDLYRNRQYLSGTMFNRSVIQQASETGRTLFRFLAMGNVMAWLLIAPALTATGLAKERERGLLESLWLSAFRVSGQVLGRLSATLCYLFALQVAVLPVYGIALLLGGVSPSEIAVAGLIIAVAALLGASIGLWYSARAYRSSSALGAVFVSIAIWSFIVFQTMESMWSGTGFDPKAFGIVFSHPVPLLYFLLSPEYFSRYGTTPFSRSDALIYSLSFQFTTVLALLWSTMRVASRPLPDRRWSEGNPHIKAWRTRFEAAKKERQERREREKATQKVTGALLYELPIEKFVRFRDPLLSREVRGRFRLRQSGLGTSLLRLGVFGLGVAFWLAVVFQAFDRASHSSSGQLLLNGLLGFGILAVAVMASTSLVRERESGTWEGLRLSLLPPLTVVRSKWLSPLITFIYWSAPLWILLPLCVNWPNKGGVPWHWLAWATLVMVASLGAVSAWGLWISRRAPHSAAATSWTLATLLLFWVGVPVFDSITNFTPRITSALYYGRFSAQPYYDYYDRDVEYQRELCEQLLGAYHPFITLNTILNEEQRNGWYDEQYGERPRYSEARKVSVGLLHLLYCGSATAGLLWMVTRRMKRIEE